MKRRAANARPTSGFTAVEVLLGAALLASMLLVAGLATERCMAMFRQHRAAEAVSSSASRLLQRVASELAFARRSSLQPATLETQGASTLLFQRSLGVVDGGVQWSPPLTLRWEREPGEIDDGQDNDGNGLIDDGQLLWIESEGLAEERRVVFGHGLSEFLPGETFDGADEDGDGLIDERGLCLSLEGNVLTIRLGLQGRSPTGTILTKVVETAVFVRN
jgi:hypothetical protein